MKKWYKILLLVALSLLLTACNLQGGQDGTGESRPVDSTLRCLEISRFSGQFVEDGTDCQVTDVAAILVANYTGKFVDLATVTYTVGDRTATFKVTGLADGEQAWVLESNAMQISPSDQLEFDDCRISYHADPMLTTDALQVSRDGHALTLTNVSSDTLANVCVYYKNRMDEGMFMGGITYQMIFEDMAPGQTVTLSRDHFVDRSVIVRFSYQVK